jgi:hypothetical protein
MKQYLRCISVVVFLLQFSLAGMSQDTGSLAPILQAARNPYIKPEALDQLMIRLRSIAPGENGVQPDSLFLAYRLVANGYALNNHFRQAYDCYRNYLAIKESTLAKARKDSLIGRQQAISLRVKKEEEQVLEGNNLVQNLQIDIDQQTSRHAFMRQFFSIGLVALTALVALMLVRSSMRLNGYKNHLKESRRQLRELHRKALLGKLSRGIYATRVERRSAIAAQCNDLVKTIQSLPAEAGTDPDRKRWLEQARQVHEAFTK